MRYNGGHRGWKSTPLGAPTDVRFRSPVIDDDIEPLSNVTLDTIVGSSHYVPASPEHRARSRSQRRMHAEEIAKEEAKMQSAANIYPFNHVVHPTMQSHHELRHNKRHNMNNNKSNNNKSNNNKNNNKHKGKQSHRNALHILGADSSTPAIKEDAVQALWEEWIEGEHRESSQYESVALECERRLSKAAVLSKRHGSPNSLRTAVAFDCLDQLGSVFGRYGSVFQTLRAELEQSIYVDGNVSTAAEINERTKTTTKLMNRATTYHHRRASRSMLEEDDDDEEDDPEVLYGQRTTFFEQATLLEVERSRILNMADHLKATLEDWESNKTSKKRHHGDHHGHDNEEHEEGSAGHVWAELLERGRHENRVAMLLSKVSHAHSHFKKHTEIGNGNDSKGSQISGRRGSAAGGGNAVQKVMAAFRHLKNSEQAMFMQEILSSEVVSQTLLKRMMEGAVVRMRPKNVCRIVGKELARREMEHANLDPKMKLKSRDIHKLFAHLSSFMNNKDKQELQLHMLQSMLGDRDSQSDPDDYDDQVDQDYEQTQNGTENGTENGTNSSKWKKTLRVSTIEKQVEMLGGGELARLMHDMNTVPKEVAELAKNETNKLNTKLKDVHEVLSACHELLKQRTMTLKRRLKTKKSTTLVELAMQENDPFGIAASKTASASFSASTSSSVSTKEEDDTMTKASSLLFKWMSSYSDSDSKANCNDSFLGEATLSGALQDGTILFDVTHKLLAARAKEGCNADEWDEASVEKWRVDGENEMNTRLLLANYIFPGLTKGLYVPSYLCSTDQLYNANPDVAVSLGTYLFCTYGNTNVEFVEDTMETDDPTLNVDGKSSDEAREQHLLKDGLSAVQQVTLLSQRCDTMFASKQEANALLLRQCLRRGGEQWKQHQLDYQQQHQHQHQNQHQKDGGVNANNNNSESNSNSENSVGGKSSNNETRDSHEKYRRSEFDTFGVDENNNEVRYSALGDVGSRFDGDGDGGSGSSSKSNGNYGFKGMEMTLAQQQEATRFRRLLRVADVALQEMYKFEDGEENCVNEIIGEASNILAQVFRNYASRSQASTGAAKIARKDFVKMAKDSHLIDVSTKKAKVIRESSDEALAAMKIQAAERGRKDRQKVGLIRQKSVAKDLHTVVNTNTNIKEEQDSYTMGSQSTTKKNKNKDQKFSRRSSLRSQMLSTKHYGRKHAERAFDQVAQGELAINLSQFAEAIIRLGMLRFATSNKLCVRHTVDERTTLVVDAICRYAKRSDVKAFRSMVLRQPGVKRIIAFNKNGIQQAFTECASLIERGTSAKTAATKTAATKTAAGNKKKKGKRNMTTTLSKFERWLEAVGKGESRGGEKYNMKGKAWHKLPGLGKKKAREIFGHVQRLDWYDGTVSTQTDDLEMTLSEFEEALVAVALHVDPDPFRAMDQRVEAGLERILGIEDES